MTPAMKRGSMLGLLFLATAPALFLMWYIWRKDCYEPEPLGLIVKVFLFGCLSVIPAFLLEYPFPDSVFTSSLVAPVAEELVKFSVVFLVMYHHPEFDEPMDGIVYAAAAGLGFATIENIFYVMDGGFAVGIVRAFLSVPGHVIFSCIWGFALGIAKFRPEPSRPFIIGAGLILAMLLHGIFNFSLDVFEALGFLLIVVVIVPLGWWITCRNIRCAHADPASACSAMGRAFIRAGNGTAFPPAAGPVAGRHCCARCGAQCPDGARFCADCGSEQE